MLPLFLSSDRVPDNTVVRQPRALTSPNVEHCAQSIITTTYLIRADAEYPQETFKGPDC